MQWQVTGAIEETGDEVTLIVDGRNEEDARRSLNLKGVLVESVSPIHPRSPSEMAHHAAAAIGHGIQTALYALGCIAGVALIVGGVSAGSMMAVCAGMLCFVVVALAVIAGRLSSLQQIPSSTKPPNPKGGSK